MTTPLPMPPAGEDPNDLADRAPDRVREQTADDLGPATDDEDVDPADAERRLELDPEEQPNATDPDYDPDADTAG